ncbi:MAG TPA: class I SAM-dependent methyltransferase [Myxococcota bacterium]|nr:class I SAM-dependent methyltransferase [Myxococcota bacterium]
MTASRRTRASWNAGSDEYQSRHGERLRETALAWGVWGIPESELGVLGPLEGRDVLELGCGAAQWTLALRAARVRAVGIDQSERQLAHARTAARSAPARAPLVQGNAERLPFRDACFDLVFCDHGAMTFASPDFTVAEAARVLRTGGLFAFCMSTPILDVCWDTAADRLGTTLRAPYFELSEHSDGESVVCQRPYGAWIRLFRRNALAIEDLIELRPPPAATTTYAEYAPLEWARSWPAEHIWKARKTRDGEPC